MTTISLPRLYRHHTHYHASLLLSFSAAITTIRIFLFVPSVPPLLRISSHILCVSSHFRPPRLCLPRTTISFVPVIYSLTIVHMFRSSEERIPSPASAIPFLLLSICSTSILLLLVDTNIQFCLWCDRVFIPLVCDTIVALLQVLQ